MEYSGNSPLTIGEILAERERVRIPAPKFLITSEGIRSLGGRYGTADEIESVRLSISERRAEYGKEKHEMSGLILHNGCGRVTRDELAETLTPIPTATHKPVPHIEIAELIGYEARHRGYEIRSEEYGLNPAGTKMFGVFKFSPTGNPEHSRALGFRNSHDKSMAVGLTAGLSVLVCDNLCFGGETVIHRKHTSGIVIEDLVTLAFDNLDHQFVRLEKSVDELKATSITVSQAKLLTVRAAEIGAINSSDILPVINEFRSPRHEEFAYPTRWNLYNAFTELAKKYTPPRADRCYRKLGGLFGLN